MKPITRISTPFFPARLSIEPLKGFKCGNRIPDPKVLKSNPSAQNIPYVVCGGKLVIKNYPKGHPSSGSYLECSKCKMTYPYKEFARKGK